MLRRQKTGLRTAELYCKLCYYWECSVLWRQRTIRMKIQIKSKRCTVVARPTGWLELWDERGYVAPNPILLPNGRWLNSSGVVHELAWSRSNQETTPLTCSSGQICRAHVPNESDNCVFPGAVCCPAACTRSKFDFWFETGRSLA